MAPSTTLAPCYPQPLSHSCLLLLTHPPPWAGRRHTPSARGGPGWHCWAHTHGCGRSPAPSSRAGSGRTRPCTPLAPGGGGGGGSSRQPARVRLARRTHRAPAHSWTHVVGLAYQAWRTIEGGYNSARSWLPLWLGPLGCTQRPRQGPLAHRAVVEAEGGVHLATLQPLEPQVADAGGAVPLLPLDTQPAQVATGGAVRQGGRQERVVGGVGVQGEEFLPVASGKDRWCRWGARRTRGRGGTGVGAAERGPWPQHLRQSCCRQHLLFAGVCCCVLILCRPLHKLLLLLWTAAGCRSAHGSTLYTHLVMTPSAGLALRSMPE